MSFNIQQSDFGRNGKLVNKSGGGTNSSMYSGVQFESGSGLRIDQTPGDMSYYTERKQPFSITDYQYSTMVSNTPTNRDSETVVKNQLSKMLEKPETIYKKVVDDARTLPYIGIIEPNLSTLYSNIILKNFTNLYTYAPTFYLQIVRNQKNILEYQKFIYLLVIIKFCDAHRDDKDFLGLDDSVKILVEWCKLKKLPDIDFYIQGPQCPTNYVNSVQDIKSNSDKVLLFSEIYGGLISTSNVVSNISNYLQVTEQQNLNKRVSEVQNSINNRPNSFDKLLNEAGSYTLSIDTAVNCQFNEDENNNLIVDFSGASLGNSNKVDMVNLSIDSAEISMDPIRAEPKIAGGKMTRLMNNYTNFNIKNLLISKQTFKTSLDAFDKLYVVFPGITLDGKFNQVYTTGTLQVSGRFKTNQNTKYWEFVPDNENGLTYNPMSVNVKSTDFYISDCPSGKNSLSYYAFKTSVKNDNYYNCPIIVQPLGTEDMDTYIIRINSIGFGKIQEKAYTFLYNRSIGTLQLLNETYDFDSVPKFEKKGRYRVISQPDELYKPVMSVTKEMIRGEVIRALNSKQQSRGIVLPNVVQPITVEQIRALQKAEQQTFSFNCSTYRLFDSNARAINPEHLVRLINFSTYNLTNPLVIIDLNYYYQDAVNKRQETVSIPTSMYGENGDRVIVTKSLINPKTGKYMDYTTFCRRNSVIGVDEYSSLLYEQINNQYILAKRSYEAEDHSLVGSVELRNELGDFTSQREYDLYNGLFTPDYEYIIDYSSTLTARGRFVGETSDVINNYVFNFSDFLTQTEDGDIVFKDYYDNGNNRVIVPDNLKIITSPFDQTDPAGRYFSGTSIGFIDENGEFVERKSFYTTTTKTEIELEQPDSTTGNTIIAFENVWRRIVYQNQDDYMNNADVYTIDFVSRSMNSEKNINKTYKIDTDLFNIDFTVDDFIFSYLLMLNPSEVYGKTYSNINELGLSLVTDNTKNTKPGLFEKKVKVKYFINFIEQNKMGLLIKQPNFDFNTLDVMFKGESYILETINNNLFMINYKEPLDGTEVVYSKGSRVKIIIEMK